MISVTKVVELYIKDDGEPRNRTVDKFVQDLSASDGKVTSPNELGVTCLETMLTFVVRQSELAVGDTVVELDAFRRLLGFVKSRLPSTSGLPAMLDVYFRTRSTSLALLFPPYDMTPTAGETLVHQLVRQAAVRRLSKKKFSDLLDLLVTEGSNVHAINDVGLTPAALAESMALSYQAHPDILSQYIEILRGKMERCTALTSGLACNDMLHDGCATTNATKVRIALGEGAYVNCIRRVPAQKGVGSTIFTPAHYPSTVEIINLLANAGADFNFFNFFHSCSELFGVGFVSETPVQSVLGAAQTQEQWRSLRDCGAKYNQKELYDKLKEACYEGDESSVDYYLDAGAPICSHKDVYEYKNTNSPSPLFIACTKYFTTIRNMLLSEPVSRAEEKCDQEKRMQYICEEALRRGKTVEDMQEMYSCLERYKSPNTSMEMWENFLMEGAIAGEPNRVNFVLQNQKNNIGRKMLYEALLEACGKSASFDRPLEIVQALLGVEMTDDKGPLCQTESAGRSTKMYALDYALLLESPVIAILLFRSNFKSSKNYTNTIITKRLLLLEKLSKADPGDPELLAAWKTCRIPVPMDTPLDVESARADTLDQWINGLGADDAISGLLGNDEKHKERSRIIMTSRIRGWDKRSTAVEDMIQSIVRDGKEPARLWKTLEAAKRLDLDPPDMHFRARMNSAPLIEQYITGLMVQVGWEDSYPEMGRVLEDLDGLLRRGADINALNSGGRTPLAVFKQNSSWQSRGNGYHYWNTVYRFLRGRGARINNEDEARAGERLLTGCRMRNPDFVVAAIDGGAYVNYGGALTVLLDAEMDEKEETNITSILNTLAAKGVDVNPTEEWMEGGITPPQPSPLGTAVRHRLSPSILKRLRQLGAVRHLHEKNERLLCASEEGNLDTVMEELHDKAEPNCRRILFSRHSQTSVERGTESPISLACLRGHVHIVFALLDPRWGVEDVYTARCGTRQYEVNCLVLAARNLDIGKFDQVLDVFLNRGRQKSVWTGEVLRGIQNRRDLYALRRFHEKFRSSSFARSNNCTAFRTQSLHSLKVALGENICGGEIDFDLLDMLLSSEPGMNLDVKGPQGATFSRGYPPSNYFQSFLAMCLTYGEHGPFRGVENSKRAAQLLITKGNTLTEEEWYSMGAPELKRYKRLLEERRNTIKSIALPELAQTIIEMGGEFDDRKIFERLEKRLEEIKIKEEEMQRVKRRKISHERKIEREKYTSAHRCRKCRRDR